MEENFKVFPERYNKILELVQSVDSKLFEKYKKVMSSVPSSIIEKLNEDERFDVYTGDFQYECKNYDGMLLFEITRLSKFNNITISMYPFYDDELLECNEEDFLEELTEDEKKVLKEKNEQPERLFFFSLSFTDSPKKPKLNLFYDEKDGGYVLNDCKIDGKEFDFEVFIERFEGKFSIVSRKSFNDFVLEENKTPIDFDELVEFANTDYENESEDEFGF